MWFWCAAAATPPAATSDATLLDDEVVGWTLETFAFFFPALLVSVAFSLRFAEVAPGLWAGIYDASIVILCGALIYLLESLHDYL